MITFLKFIFFLTLPIIILIVLILFLEFLKIFFKIFGVKLIFPITNDKIKNPIYNSIIIIILNIFKICDNNMNLYYKILYKENLDTNELKFLNSKLK